jgi:hypothetical protein
MDEAVPIREAREDQPLVRATEAFSVVSLMESAMPDP